MRLGRGVFTKGEDTHPLFSLRLGHARGKTTLGCFLTPSRRFATLTVHCESTLEKDTSSQ